MFGRQPAVKHMLLDSESTKYLGDDEGKLKIEVMRKLYHIIAYNLAKSRAARDGNKCDEENKLEEEQFEPVTTSFAAACAIAVKTLEMQKIGL